MNPPNSQDENGDDTVEQVVAPWGVGRTRARKMVKRIMTFVEDTDVETLTVNEGYGWTWIGVVLIIVGLLLFVFGLWIGEFTPDNAIKKLG
jgi:hypothetical protein